MEQCSTAERGGADAARRAGRCGARCTWAGRGGIGGARRSGHKAAGQDVAGYGAAVQGTARMRVKEDQMAAPREAQRAARSAAHLSAPQSKHPPRSAGSVYRAF